MKRIACIIYAVVSLAALHVSGQDYEVTVPDINSVEAEFGPQYYKDGIVFCSTRSKTSLSFVDDTLSRFYTDLFFARNKGGGKYSNPEIFSPELTTVFNEGPVTFTEDENTVYYTANIEPKDATKKTKIKEYKLGIFIAHYVDGHWQKAEPFPFNTSDCKFDVAHPALSPGDTVLYFASNMVGGQGGTDIYRCYWRDGRWSVPVNLGAPVNTKGNELYPFVSENGSLYFTSDGNDEENGMDIFMARKSDKGFRTPVRLPEPINSTYDDFGLVTKNKGHEGYFSSNRDGEFDDIYAFSRPVPDFEGCHENSKPKYCYEFSDPNVMPVDSLPLVYEWDLGDGTHQRGLRIKHCFKEIGKYEVKLNLIDTLTKMVFFTTSRSVVDVRGESNYFIASSDTVAMNTPMVLAMDGSPASENEQYFWIMDTGDMEGGEKTTYHFDTPGTHTVTFGTLTAPDASGMQEKSCIQKTIVVMPDSVAWNAQAYELREQKTYEPVRMIPVFMEEKDPSNPMAKPYYRVVFLKSEERVPFNNPIFSKVEVEITESRDRKGYEYSVGSTTNIQSIYPVFNKLAESGFKDLMIDANDRSQFAKQIVRTGEYITPGNADKLNVEFMQLSDIKFEYNSAAIKTESYGNLDYIVSMLKLETDFEIKIQAHTCNAGNPAYNLKLSDRRAKSVVDYFLSKGIDSGRMQSKGYGDTKPLVSNDTEEGRRQNRRVEFVIIFPQNK